MKNLDIVGKKLIDKKILGIFYESMSSLKCNLKKCYFSKKFPRTIPFFLPTLVFFLSNVATATTQLSVPVYFSRSHSPSSYYPPPRYKLRGHAPLPSLLLLVARRHPPLPVPVSSLSLSAQPRQHPRLPSLLQLVANCPPHCSSP